LEIKNAAGIFMSLVRTTGWIELGEVYLEAQSWLELGQVDLEAQSWLELGPIGLEAQLD
jgi:hypothetical protein